jgi:hypothetical protein
MKLLMESWRQHMNEYARPASDPSKVKVVSDILYYFPEGGRLFLVAEFEQFIGGPKMKFGFYSSRGASVPGTEGSAWTWVPAVGIKEDSGWIMKIPGKYPHPKSLLAMVGHELGKKVPADKQMELRMAGKGEFTTVTKGQRGARLPREGEKQRRKEEINKQTKNINQMFKSHGVYDIAPETAGGGGIS